MKICISTIFAQQIQEQRDEEYQQHKITGTKLTQQKE